MDMDYGANRKHIPPKKSDILRELVDNFGKILHLSTIKEIAQHHDYDVQKSTMAILQLTSLNNNSLRTLDQPSTSKSFFSKKSRLRNAENYVSTFIIEEAIDDILSGFKILVILRGLPGSGKSYLAKSLIDASIGTQNYSDHIFGTDNYFIKCGEYFFEPRKLQEAHYWNQKCVFEKMLRGLSPIIVDNTNTQMWEMQPYARISTQCGYKIHILEANTKWSFDCRDLERKNQHNIRKASIVNMMDRYEKNITPELLLASLKLSMIYQQSPQMRRDPPIRQTNGIICPSNSTRIDSSLHNHNALNQDLKLPDHNISVQRTETRQTSRCEVSNLIEISDDDDDANLKVEKNFENPARSTTNITSESSNYSGWGINEEVLKSWNIVIPLKEDQSVPLVNSSSNSSSDNNKRETCDRASNTSFEDFHKAIESSRIMNARYRDINPPQMTSPLKKSGFLDKSSSTGDDMSSDRNEDLKKLVDVFPNIPPVHLRDMYDDCNGNFDMTVEIFLEDDKDYSNYPFGRENIIDDTGIRLNDSKKPRHDDYDPDMKARALFLEKTVPREELAECASNSLKELRKSDSNESKWIDTPNHPHTSSFGAVTTQNAKVDNETIIDSDSDLEFDNCPSQIDSDSRSDENDNIELNLGHALIEQLETEFGDPGNDYPKGFLPVVQVPKSFARQLYAFYVESVYQQMETQKSVLDKLVIEDEAFARKLFQEENGLAEERPKEEGLRDIMHEQMAINIYEKDVAQWNNCNSDDLASMLTKKKLISSFPTVEENVLLEIYHANNQNYKQTVEDLLVSVDSKDVHCDGNIKDPPISQNVIQELKDAEDEFSNSKDEDELPRTFQYYRDEANEYLNKRTELYNKAQSYYCQGQREVAQFFSQLAQKQTKFYDMANNKAATVLLEEHSQRLQNFDTLDLHFLFVKEAIPALDVFIDRNINLLRGGTHTSQNLLVITGRGNRSKNGVSKIKPAVMSRLKTRKIKFVQLNPGLLKIKIYPNSVITSDL